MMKAIYVDDERSAHVNFYYDMKDRTEIDALSCFFNGEEAISFAEENAIDCAFLDVQLGGGESGVDLAKALKQIHPNLEVVFVTAYDHHARAAYRVGGRAYLTKPYTQEELDESLYILQKLTNAHRTDVESSQRPKERAYMKTFGNFDLLVNKQPIAFKNAKAKELLAFLVHQRGGTVTGAQVLFALWEHLEYTTSTSTYVRRTARALRDELTALGLQDIFINKRNCYSVDTSRFLCDYYKLMTGDIEIASHYNGEYMNQYSWGEGTNPLIERKIESIKRSDIKN